MPGSIVLFVGLFLLGAGVGASVASAYAGRNMRRLQARWQRDDAAQVERISERVLARLTAALGDDEGV